MEMVQQDLQFHPFVLIVPAGAVVAFPNRDDVRHHVYSFSPAHPFELKLYGRDETRTVRFDHPGAIALGCNIHDNMIAFIKVVDTPYAAKSGADGVASLRGAPPGQAVLHVWHPYLRAAGNEIVRTITLPQSRRAPARSLSSSCATRRRAINPTDMPTFRRLRTKLTILYAGLFAGVVLLISLVVYTAVSNNVTRLVREELVASGTVFDRVWALRAAQLENGAGLLSRDFGFREAIASNDQATIRSALDNLKVRLGIDQALMIGADGHLIAADGAPVGAISPGALQALEGDGTASGVLMIGGAPHEVVSVPILAPTVMGWVVFAAKLDHAQMTALERLSAIPLDASVLDRDASGRWSDADGRLGVGEARRIGGYVDQAMATHSWAPQVLSTADGPTAVMVKPLTVLSPDAPAALLLSYPMSRAMAPYQPLLYAVVVTALTGLALLVLGSWALARSLTRPILALDEAATRLKNGERTEVAVVTGDEIGRLAESFNAMAAEIGKRERRITHLALHDPDTDLPNHQWLQRRLERTGGDDLFVAALGVDRYAHVRGAIGYDLAGELVGEIGAHRAPRPSGRAGRPPFHRRARRVVPRERSRGGPRRRGGDAGQARGAGAAGRQHRRRQPDRRPRLAPAAWRARHIADRARQHRPRSGPRGPPEVRGVRRKPLRRPGEEPLADERDAPVDRRRADGAAPPTEV